MRSREGSRRCTWSTGARVTRCLLEIFTDQGIGTEITR